MDQIDAIAVTYGPGLAGSLLVGVEAAKTLALCYNKPLIGVNHMAGHIYANNLVDTMDFPLICLVISGGHTEIIYMDQDLSFKRIGSITVAFNEEQIDTLKSLQENDLGVTNKDLDEMRKGVIEFHGVFYTIDNILPKAYIEDVFILYHFVCTEDKYVTEVLVEEIEEGESDE